MTAVLVGGCAVLGVVAGFALDGVATRVPERQPVFGAGYGDAIRPRRAAFLAFGCGALFAGMAVRFDDSWALPAYLVLSAGLLLLSVIDLEHFLLPNRVVYPTGVTVLALLGLAAVGDDAGSAFVRALLGGATAFVGLLVLHLVSPRSLGFGDVRLAFVLGVALGWLGWGEVALGLFLGFFYGAVVGVGLIVTRLRTRKDHVPFGPFLAAGTITVVLWGEPILRWYDGGA